MESTSLLGSVQQAAVRSV